MSAQRQDHAVLAFVGLGSNVGSPLNQIRDALDELDRVTATRVVRRSSLYRTAPVGYRDQPDFVNAVASLETVLPAPDLLAALLELETKRGRVRTVPDGPRTLDLDLLLYGDDVIALPGLVVPHPRMLGRAFVMAPLAEIAPNLNLGLEADLRTLAARLSAEQRVERIAADAVA